MALDPADHTKLAWSIAAKFFNVPDHEAVVCEAMLALVRGAQAFDETLGYRPSSFLMPVIRFACLSEARRQRAEGDRRVMTVAEGEVVFAGPFPGLGNTIILNHGDRYHTVYAHLSSIAHEVGQKVRQNEMIGSLAASDPMLHFEIRSEGKAVDPVPWLAGGEAAFSR